MRTNKLPFFLCACSLVVETKNAENVKKKKVEKCGEMFEAWCLCDDDGKQKTRRHATRFVLFFFFFSKRVSNHLLCKREKKEGSREQKDETKRAPSCIGAGVGVSWNSSVLDRGEVLLGRQGRP